MKAVVDLTDEAQVDAATRAMLEGHRSNDILVNDAGITGRNDVTRAVDARERGVDRRQGACAAIPLICGCNQIFNALEERPSR
jgi:NAD(P)-dependent dehydrogenase (short-subunit alcohol dehydrogenase family)